MDKKFEEGYREAFENLKEEGYQSLDDYYFRGFILKHSDKELDEIMTLDNESVVRMYDTIRKKKRGTLDWWSTNE